MSVEPMKDFGDYEKVGIAHYVCHGRCLMKSIVKISKVRFSLTCAVHCGQE